MSNTTNNNGQNNTGPAGGNIAIQRQNSTTNVKNSIHSQNIDSFFSRFTGSSPSKSSLGGFSSGSTSQSQINMNELYRRPSGNLSKISYLYNNTFAPSSQQNSVSSGTNDSGSDNNTPSFTGNTANTAKENSSPEFHATCISPERAIFQTTNEILACDRSWETPNLIAISTPRNLQLFKASETDLTLETDLMIKSSGRVKIGTISDLSFGHQQYGRFLAASTITGSIHIYHFDRGSRAKSALTGHNRAVNTIDFNHITPHLLASGSQDGKILIWDLRTSNSKPTFTLACNADSVRSCSFNNKKGNILAAVFDSGVVEKWDLRKTNTWERRINAHNGPALTVNWHPELDYIVTGGRDKQLQVWNLETGFETREPTHVINTSGPISKAKWCKGRGNGSIMNTDIAVSFYNDDPCVQIWNLNRKFIPKKVIEGHTGPITQIVWRTPKHLISCSKDKTLIQYDVTRENDFIDNLPSVSFSWNPSQVIDFAFVKQSKSQFQGPFINSSNSIGGVDNMEDIGNSNVPPQNMNASDASGMQLYELSTKSPSGNSPTFNSSLKMQRQQLLSRQPSYHKSTSRERIPSARAPLPWIMPVHIPLLANDMEKTNFLSTNYMIRVPDGADIIDVCEYNSMLASSVGHFRDSKTWSTIKTALILELEMLKEEIVEKKLSKFSFNKSESFSQSNSRLGTSYGSESDIMNNSRREISTSLGSNFIDDTAIDEHAVIDDNSEDEKVNASSIIDANLDVKRKEGFKNAIAKHCEEANNKAQSYASTIVSSHSELNPIAISSSLAKRRRSNLQPYRYSFTESSVDLDDEKHASPLSLSLSSSPRTLDRRRNLLFEQISDAGGEETNALSIIKSMDTRLSKTPDTKSQLTAILKESKSGAATVSEMAIAECDENKEHKSSLLVVPWNPKDMIKQACEYCCSQGDILMCATLAMLFAGQYPDAVPQEKCREWIYCYHEHLLHCGYFANAATILRVASESYESFKTIGQTKTSVRTSGRQLAEGCGYCKEPVKGNAVALVECGHGGHFQCFRSWFVEQGETDCPCCGLTAIKPAL